MSETKPRLSPEEIMTYFQNEFKTKIKSSQIKKHKAGLKKNETSTIWFKIEKEVI